MIRRAKKITIGVGGWATDSMTKIFQEMDFTPTTGIEVEVATRPGTAPEMITQMAAAIQAKTSPYDVIDFEDEIAATFSRAHWLKGLDDLLPANFWNDFPQNMIDMRDVWDVYEGATFRIHHNYEACYWWYRKDWFDAKGVQVPTTWDEVAQMGAVFTDEASDVWATEDGLTSGGFLNVYLAWITLQAGGNPFDADDKYRTALEYIKSLMDNKTLNPASLQKSYDQQNADYQADKVAFMRQWRYFYDLAHGNTDWYADGKAEIGLPPAGPVGKPLTYVAGWGWGIPTTTLSVMAALLASYAFARIAVPGRNILLWLFILSMSLPDIVTVIPLYRLLANMGLLDSLVGLTLIMSSVLVPFTVWVLIAFIQQGPYDIEEAAIIDGANLFKIFRYIMIPLTSPALATMFVINFINSWNNLLYPLAFSGSPKSKTLSVAITEIYQARAPWGRPWNLVSTLGVVMVVPVIILVMFSQKAIVRGLTRGAIK